MSKCIHKDDFSDGNCDMSNGARETCKICVHSVNSHKCYINNFEINGDNGAIVTVFLKTGSNPVYTMMSNYKLCKSVPCANADVNASYLHPVVCGENGECTEKNTCECKSNFIGDGVVCKRLKGKSICLKMICLL